MKLHTEKLNKREITTLYSFILLSFIFLFCPAQALSNTPTELIKISINEVLSILNDKEMHKPENSSLRDERIKNIIYERFDFNELTKRSLGVHWRRRSEPEKEEFTRLFSKYLEKSYKDKLYKNHDAQVDYLNEKIKDNKYATVSTQIVTKQEVKIPVQYKLIKKNEDWKVYDVVIEGVSMVSNYRTQFNKIIRKSSFKELMKRLEDKISSNPAPKQAN